MSPAAKKRVDAFLAEATQVDHIVSKQTAIRVSDDGTIATTTLPLTVPGWEVTEGQTANSWSTPPKRTAATASRSSSAATRSTARRKVPAPRGSASSAPRSCC